MSKKHNKQNQQATPAALDAQQNAKPAPKGHSVIAAERKRAYGKLQTCGDEVARELAGQPLEAICAKWGIDLAAYAHLNKGMQRMNVGNRIRAIRRRQAEEAALALAA